MNFAIAVCRSWRLEYVVYAFCTLLRCVLSSSGLVAYVVAGEGNLLCCIGHLDRI